jgi:MFS family permease
MAVSLAGIGLFAAIYHPVGIPWLVRHAPGRRGKVLGVNGIFGALGSALAGIVAGGLIDLAGWRAAFLVPGGASVATGAALVLTMRGSLGVEREPVEATKRGASVDVAAPSRSDSRRVFGILLVTMFLAGLIFHITQTSVPKLFELRHDGLVAEGAFGVGMLVALVYGAAGLFQVVGGHLADKFSLKWVYVGALVTQAPLLWLAAFLSGLPLVLVVTFMVMANASALPAENMLLARYVPTRRHGFVFGLKFVLSFGAAPLAVAIVAFLSDTPSGFRTIFVLTTLAAAISFSSAMFLPGARRPLSAPPTTTATQTSGAGSV